MSVIIKKSEDHKAYIIWSIISSLYTTQGIPMGVTFGALPAILRYEGYSTESIGLLGLVMIPWALKFLWAPFVDRHSGGSYMRRRRWLIPIQLAQATLLMGIALLPSDIGIGSIALAILFVSNLISATQDIATDGLAIEMIPKDKLGWINSAQIGGFAFGMILGGSATTALYAQGGLPLSFAILSLITFITVIPLVWYKVALTKSVEFIPLESVGSASLMKFFKRENAFYFVSIAATFYFSHAMVDSITSPFLVDTGISLSTIAFISGAGMTSVTIVSAGLGGLIVNWLGVKFTAISAGFCAAFALSLWLIPSYFGLTSLSTIITITLINGVVSGIAYVAFFALFMQWASSDQAGTDFSLLQSTETISNIIAMSLGGLMAGAIGFSGNLLVASCVGVVFMTWISFALKRMDVTKPKPAW